MPLTPTEKVDIETHLGWLLFQQPLLVNGNIVEHQMISLLRSTVERTEEKAVYRVRECLCELQRCLDERKRLRGRAGIVQVGDVKIDVSGGLMIIDEEFKVWANKLADIYGGHKNLYSLYHQQVGNVGTRLQESF